MGAPIEVQLGNEYVRSRIGGAKFRSLNPSSAAWEVADMDMIWIVPGLFAAVGVLNIVFAGPFVDRHLRRQRSRGYQPMPETRERELAQWRGVGAALLATAVVFAVLIAVGVFP